MSLAAVKSLLTTGSPGVTTSAVGKVLDIDTSAAYRRVSSTLARGYLRNLEERPRRPARLVLGEALPDDQELLPSPDSLHDCMADRGDTASPLGPEACTICASSDVDGYTIVGDNGEPRCGQHFIGARGAAA